jgi:hypothetical protein
MKRSMDWRAMLRPRARRKAPLKKEPRSDARAQPKERSWGEVLRSETWTATRATTKPIRSLS